MPVEVTAVLFSASSQSFFLSQHDNSQTAALRLMKTVSCSLPGFHRHWWREQMEAVLYCGRCSVADWLLLWCLRCYRRPLWYVRKGMYYRGVWHGL